MINYEEALNILTIRLKSLTKTKIVPLLDSVKHVSAKDIYATLSLPAQNISLKDGYAYIGDTNYEVATGEPLKPHTKYVIPYEEDHKNAHHMYNIKQSGEDIQKGELLLSCGELITAYGITSLASQGAKSIEVFDKPIASILSIGDNLCPIQKKIKNGEVYNTNALSLAARILEVGAKINKVWQVKNEKNAIKQHIEELSKQSDFIITTGAMSKHDAMSRLIYDNEFEILFHKVQISPAMPTAFTTYKQTPILHLTGLPLSSLLGFELLGVFAIKKMKNEFIAKETSLYVKNQKEFICKDSCTSAIPGFFDGHSFKSAPSFGAGMLNVLSKCNGYALIKNKPLVKTDELVEFFSF